MNWKETICSLNETQEDALWLISHASYLVKTGGMLWGVDLRLSKESRLQADETLFQDLKDVKVAMLTHTHSDHYDKALIERMAAADIHWIFPRFLPEDQQQTWKSKLARCSFVGPGEELCIRGLKIQTFESDHYDYFKGELWGVDEIGYRVEAGGKVFVFPGDIRKYEKLPDIQKGADEFFAHIWLGREAALAPDKALVEEVCRYFASSEGKRVWLAHLNDVDRLDIDRWTEAHAAMVREGILRHAPHIPVEIPEHGKKYLL